MDEDRKRGAQILGKLAQAEADVNRVLEMARLDLRKPYQGPNLERIYLAADLRRSRDLIIEQRARVRDIYGV